MSNPVHLEWSNTMRPLFDERVARDGAGHPAEVFALDPGGEPGLSQMTYRMGLRPGSADAVATLYREAPAEVGDALRTAGVRRQWTWVEDGGAWSYLECDDLDATEAALAASDVYRGWTATLDRFVDERTKSEGRRRTREVFRCD